jgi:AraC-like DNA-binding protein
MITNPDDLMNRPADEAQRPSGAFDLLSYVLAQLRLAGDEVASVRLGAPMVIGPEAGVAYVLVVIAGRMSVRLSEGRVIAADTGDLILLSRSAGQVLEQDAQLGEPDSAEAEIVLSRFRFDPPRLDAMFRCLPHHIHVRRADGAEWLAGLAQYLLAEARGIEPGASLMISRLIDLMVIRAIRHWVHQGRGEGWLGGMADPRVARSLEALHAAPFRAWSVRDLAKLAGMSRSSFSERFADLVGEPPLRYHNRWRLLLAENLMQSKTMTVGEVALGVGYASTAAFSRAFKAHFGRAPTAPAD